MTKGLSVRAQTIKSDIAGHRYSIVVLNGLSVGESVSLNDGPIVVGGSDDCDLYLADPHLTRASCVLECTSEASRSNTLKVSVTTLKNESSSIIANIKGNDTPVNDTSILDFGDEIRISGIVLKLECRSVTATEGTKDTAPNCTGFATSKGINDRDEVLVSLRSQIKEQSRKWADHQRDKLRNQSEAEPVNMPPQLLWLKPFTIVMASIAICFWTISAARGGASHDYYSQYLNVNSLPASGAGPLSSSEPNTYSAPNTLGDANYSAQTAKKTLPEKGYSPEQVEYLQQVFLQMLAARELPPNVSLEIFGDELVVQGVLDGDRKGILLRMLQRFKVEQGITGEIDYQVTTAASTLPFDIVQVTSGRYGNIVTSGGDRLFVGDELAGYQLVAIQQHHVIFSGKSRITIAW